ncbi:hypothetical protein M408DRAFT_78899 [Serendipita vermifera MAFF 305830]|uniref:NAD(P)-binding protein n=1 Tax=Serendipita vermifera MAFF 305830 TaxID=933852 RepID=A0A0C2W811_SERVB|nr:hypothetical protein M408DRAFT_78899 [Serendipita vermifera MAFF 305830]
MSFNELGSSRPFFTKTIHRDVYDTIDPTSPSLALPGKTVLVTGGGRGIGIGIVESYAKAQAETIILTGRTESSLAAVQVKFKALYPKTEFISLASDIGVLEDVTALFNNLKSRVSQIDILVNNAALGPDHGIKLGETDPASWKSSVDANVSGPYYLARGLIQFNPPDFPATFISITTGVTEPFPEMSGYILTKLPGVKLVELMALEYPNNLRTYALVPGIVPTDMLPRDPKSGFVALALDKPALSGGVCVYLSHPHAEFLSGRFLDARWDMDEVVAKKEEIVSGDLLKLRIGGY